VDGNKCVGFAATYAFLAINGLTIIADKLAAFAFIAASNEAAWVHRSHAARHSNLTAPRVVLS